ncbi:MAG TPA: nickel-responsive transcriptional regulator NikR [Rhodocyclaceae bacterium]|nr:nickel-responsive transcriptional regulator NikR [Rhodocyclaceae bacterium]
MSTEEKNNLVSRISISLQPQLLEELDHMVEARGFGSRSQAIGDMVAYQLAEHKRKLGNDVMVGTITLLYDRLTRGLQKKLADLQYEYLDEVISSLHVHLTQDQVMEVILVQGPAQRLQDIANEMTTLRGVITGQLQLLAAVIPPLHPLPAKNGKKEKP